MPPGHVRFLGLEMPFARLVAVAAGLVVIAAVGLYLLIETNRTAVFHGMEFSDPRPAPDFSLQDYRGDTFTLSAEKGRVVVLYFGYTMCPDACPTTLLDFRRIHEALGKDSGRVLFVFITVDPERDTPEVLRNYMETRGNSAFLALTGDDQALREVWRLYNVYVEKAKAQSERIGYWVNHTALSYVVDTRGILRLAHPFGTDYESVLVDLRSLLKEAR